MHPSLALEGLAARKAELRAEADTLRREFCGQALKLKPITQAAQLGFDTVQVLKKSNIAIPSICGAALGFAAEQALPASGLWTRLLRGGQIASKIFRALNASQGS